MLGKIESIGLIKAIEDGTIEGWMDDYNYKAQKELGRQERVLVGVNKFVPKQTTPPKRFRFDPARMRSHIERFKNLKATRNQEPLRRTISDLFLTAHRKENFHQAMIDALIADASIGEVWGTVRVANGLSYDPFRAIESPFTYPAL
jgi:methylmalonyl-CoA mutase N-terminal domain/subunit